MSEKRNILFLCSLNTQRSVLCQYILNKYAGSRFNASSAGVMCRGERMSSLVYEILNKEEKIKKEELDEFRSRVFNYTIGKEADLIVCVTREHASYIINEYPDFSNKVTYFENYIPDNIYTMDEMRLCLSRVKASLNEMFGIEQSHIAIKKMKKSDITNAQIVENSCFVHPYDMNETYGKDKLSLCAFYDDNFAGYACSYYVLDEVNIMTFAVKSLYRRRGIGEKLLLELISKAKELNMKKIYLEVRYSNTSARLLYEKIGFEKCGLRKDYYIDPKEDAVLYEYTIE